MMGQIKVGYLVGNGAAQNVSLGFIPDKVEVYNATDGDLITIGLIGPHVVVPFSSGGTTEIVAGNVIEGETSGATATVREVLLSSGTWAGGDAAGFFVVEMGGDTDFSGEDVKVGSTANLATITANVTHSIGVSTAAASVTGNAAITRYAGSTTAAAGFTIGSTIAEEAKLLRYVATRGDA